MIMQRLLLVFGPLAIAKQPVARVTDDGVLAPKYFNLAKGSRISATATCGEDKPEVFCKLSAGSDYMADPELDLLTYIPTGTGGQFCDICDVNADTFAHRNHSIENAIDGTEKWWQSPPLSSNSFDRDYNKVNVTIDLGQVFHVAYIVIKFANSPRAGRWVLERSLDGEHFTPWQYFANHPSECERLFGTQPGGANDFVDFDDEVRCTKDFSEIPPLENGEVIVSLIKGRPGSTNFWSAPTLQVWTKASHIRLRFEQAKTLLGHLMGIMENDESVTRRYFYSIKDISIGGRCDCNGHAKECIADPLNSYKLRCQCKHNTMGISCEECMPLFNQRKWMHAERNHDNECKQCNCHNHADRCYYDEAVERKRLSLNMIGNLDGGGVCVDCKNNTTGINCERCAKSFYRNPVADMTSDVACLKCNCPSNFTDTSCDHDTGACRCKEKYTGHNCNQCAEGYTDFPECKPCPCHYDGTAAKQCKPTFADAEDTDGVCECKLNFSGQYCNVCADGFYNFPDCVPCECSGQPGATEAPCDKSTGQCQCKVAYAGLHCESCALRYHNYPQCERCYCSEEGVTEKFCNSSMVELECFCAERYIGEKCNTCDIGYHTFPTCEQCVCSAIGTKKLQNGELESCNANIGQCQCKPEYIGIKCDECQDGYYRDQNGFCIQCECNLNGSESHICDKKTGNCPCQQNTDGVAKTQGRSCDKCNLGFFNFPKCESCPCHPDGIYYNNQAICSIFSGSGTCTCKKNVVGEHCKKCANRYWNLSGKNDDGCEECGCYRSGLMNEIKDCSVADGQCNCKTRVCSRRCSQCEEGFYGLEEKNYFGCVACQCDVGGTKGGHLANTCDSNDGQCQCKNHITGRRCDDIEEGYCYPTLFQYQFEAEDGLLDNGDHVRYGFDKEKFPDFSLRGYAELSDIQPTVIMNGKIDSSSISPTSLYKIMVRFLNPTELVITARLVISDRACEDDSSLSQCDVRQEIEIQFTQNEQAETRTFRQDAILDPGEYIFRLEIDTGDLDWEEDGLFVDYIALLPDEYYEPKILRQKINEPCRYKEAKGGKCMMHTHFKLPTGSIVQEYSTEKLPIVGDFERTPPMQYNTVEAGKIQPFDRMLFIDASSNDRDILYAQMTVPNPGEYVFVMDYVNKLDRLQTLRMIVKYKENGRDTYQDLTFNAYSCNFLFPCRQVGLSANRNVEVLSIDSTEIYLDMRDASTTNQLMMYIKNIYVIPASEWNIEMVTPKPLGVTENGPKFEKIEDASYPTKPSVATQIQMDEPSVPSVVVGENVEKIFNAAVTFPGSYVFVLHYYHETSMSFNMSIAVESIDAEFHATVKLEYCPSVYGCRSLLYANNGHTFAVENTNLKFTLSYPNEKVVTIGYIMAIPEPNWSLDHLKLADINLADTFIKNCGFLIDPKSSDFCKSSARSLVISNTEAHQCKCAQAGTVNHSDKCGPYGCQCQCKPHCIGKDCSRCEVGYYGWPNCKKCSCVGNTICHETTGHCLCPKNTAADCLSCQSDAYGYHHISGCNLCECNVDGAVNSETSCHQQTGQCTCKANTMGRKCDQCLPGFYGFPNCRKCSCDERGTIGDAIHCDVTDGSCKCKANVDGPNCSRCKEGSFFLANDHPDGCISCYCSGLVNQQTNYAECSASDYAMKLIVDMDKGNDTNRWLVLGMNDHGYTDQLIYEDDLIVLDVAKGGGQANHGQPNQDIAYAPKALYWIAPSSYHGNRLGSYGGYLEYTTSWDEEKKDKEYNNALPRLNTDPDLYLTGGGMTIVWSSQNHRTGISNITMKVPLMENGFTSSRTKASISRKDLLTVLKDLQEIKIKASYPIAVSEIQIQKLSLQDTNFEDRLDVAYNGTSRATDYAYLSRVEVCSCPTGHIGSSCERCKKGYYWEKTKTQEGRFQKCQKCKCNNHCDTCDDDGVPYVSRHNEVQAATSLGISTIEIVNPKVYNFTQWFPVETTRDYDNYIAEDQNRTEYICLNHTAGSECQFCEAGYIGNPLDGTPDDCKVCPCPLENHNHAEKCTYAPKEESHFFESLKLKDEVPEEPFSYNEFMSIMVILNTAASDNSEEFDVKCKCETGYVGSICDECAPGWFGNPSMINQYCKKCDCNGNSDMFSGHAQCDSLDGTCTACAYGTYGKHCERCEPFKFGNALEKNCLECSCAICGSASCNHSDGACECKNNVIGKNCDECAPGFWDFDSCLETGCRDCECNFIGSTDTNCNLTTGECNCKPGVGGTKCDQCQKGYFNLEDAGCTKCRCPADLPCDAKTGKCFCPPGIVGEQCDKCENSRAVPLDIFGKTKCENCDQCIDWLLGPRDGQIWFDESYNQKAIQPFLHRVTEKIHDLENTKAGGLANRKLVNLIDDYEELRSGVTTKNSTDITIYTKYIKLSDELNRVQKEMYETCENVHEFENITVMKDERATKVYDRTQDLSSEFDTLLKNAKIRKSSFSDDVEDDPIRVEDAKNEAERLASMKTTILELWNLTELQSNLDLSRQTAIAVNTRYNTTSLESRSNKIFNRHDEVTKKMEQLKNYVDEVMGNLSSVLDANAINENKLSKFENDNAQLATRIQHILVTVNDGNGMNVKSRKAFLNATDLLKTLNETIGQLDGEKPENFEKFDQIRNLHDSASKQIEALNVAGKSDQMHNLAEKHAATIKAIHEDFERVFQEKMPKLQDRIAILESENITQLISLTVDNIEKTHSTLTSMAEDMQKYSKNSTENYNSKLTVTCSEQRSAIKRNAETLKDLSEKHNQNHKDMDAQVAIRHNIDQLLDQQIDYKMEEKLNNNLDKLRNSSIEATMTQFDQMTDDIKVWHDDVMSGVQSDVLNASKSGIQTDNEKLRNMRIQDTKLEDAFGDIDNEWGELIANMSDDMVSDTQKNLDEMHVMIIEIQEEIERARTLVKQLSRKNDIAYRNDHTVYDESRIPKTVDFKAETSVELMLKANSINSHIMSLISTENTDFFSLEVVNGKVHMIYQLGNARPVTLISEINVFNDGETQNWYQINAKRSGSHAILMINKHGDDDVNIVKGTSIDGLTYSRITRAAAKLFIGGISTISKPAGVSTTESDIDVAHFLLNDANIYLWDFAEKSETFDKSSVQLNIDDVALDLPAESQICEDCWQFSGEDSWVYINEETHSKYLVNKESGTIMFQLKLKAPIYADGLIFFIGDPMQTKYFIAMELVNGKPQFSYNLGYEKGPKIIALDEDQSKYIPTEYGTLPQKQLNFRIGMVGGVAGLAVQEWRSNKVVSVENDFWLKNADSKSQNCQGCEFKLVNEMHFGGLKTLGRDLSHLAPVLATWNKPYRGCMSKAKINHQWLDLSQTKRSNVMVGCKSEAISKISLNGAEMIKRDQLQTSLSNFTSTFAISLMAGYPVQDATILRVKSVNGPNCIEFGMEKDGTNTPIFYYKSNVDESKTLPIQNKIKADEEVQITIVRRDGDNVIITIGDNTPIKLDINSMGVVESEEVEIQVGGQYKNNKVKEGYHGCITSLYVNDLTHDDTVLTSVFDGFKCEEGDNRDMPTCIGEVRFNECFTNNPQSLVERPVRNEVITVVRDNNDSSSPRRGNGRRGKNRPRGKSCPNMVPIDSLEANKYQIGKNSMIKLNQRNMQSMFQQSMKLELRIDYKAQGSLLQMVNDDCTESISLLIIENKVRLLVNINDGHLIFNTEKEIPKNTNTDIILVIKPDEKNPERTKFSITVHGATKTKKLRKDMKTTTIKSLYIGRSPDSLKCADLHHTHSFTGFFYGASLNGVELRKRRFENTPSIITGSRIPGIFLGKRGTVIDMPLNGVQVNSLAFVLRPRQQSGDIFNLYSRSKDTELKLAMRETGFLLTLRIRSKYAKLILDYKDCKNKPLRISVKIGKNQDMEGISLSINKTQKNKRLEGHETVLDGGLSLGSIHGCFSNLEVNGKEPIMMDNHTAKGDQYSLNGCPKI